MKDVRYVSQTDLRTMLAKSRVPSEANSEGIASDDLIMTPWFRLLCERGGSGRDGTGLLFHWWNRLDDIEELKDDVIHNWTQT